MAYPRSNIRWTLSRRHLAALLVVLCPVTPAVGEEDATMPAAVVCTKDSSSVEKLAAKDVRRYVYLRTGKLLPIVDRLASNAEGGWIVVGTKDRPAVQALLSDNGQKAVVAHLGPEQYVLKTLRHDGQSALLVAGGDAIGTLYGAYRLAEHIGVRFYLHGDVVPDKQIALVLPRLDETRRPLFDRRGILPLP